MDRYQTLASQLSAEEFASQFEHLFLVKRPAAKGSSAPSKLDFRTTIITTRRDGNRLEDDEFAASWVIEPIRKKPGSPFPERISVGRAMNCDIPLRAAYISKLHAYFVMEVGLPMRLVDNKSANGTWVDGRRLDGLTPMPVTAGSKICLGALELQVVDPTQLFYLLKATA